ncbi:MAG: SigB/SigF/SigG family RNA polymerase sigma factor [Sporomusaceae bacterium]|nr:SigB/SigF/SigG family RNA polymerase sigma factor [Sporomusaceae bacterium]
MLTDDVFKACLVQAQAGDERAKEILVKENLNLVHSIVRRFLGRGFEEEDLFQIGSIGLLKAIERFDLTYETKFSTYAVPLILGEIRRFIRDDHPIKVSRSVKELSYQIRLEQENWQKRTGREPSLLELAEVMNLAAPEVAAALTAVQPPVSLFDPIFSADETQPVLLERLKGVEEEKNLIERLNLQQMLERLSEKERQIIKLRFFDDLTQADVASLLQLSQVQVSRLEKKALIFLRQLAANR